MTVPATNIAILFLVTFASVRADTVELKTGEKIEGVFKQAGPAGAVIEVGGQPITFALDKVRAIYLGGAPVAPQPPSAYSDALDALKALQSVTTSGINYRDYSARVLDARVKVDKYLTSPPNGDDPQRSAIRIAMQYYELTSLAWGGVIFKDFQRSIQVGGTLRGDATLLEPCPAIKTLIADSDARAAETGAQLARTIPDTPAEREKTSLLFTGTSIGQRPAILWSCAATKIAEAERH